MQIDVFLFIIFYLIILRMINFWDLIFFDKIADIYNANIFEGEEFAEIEFTYFMAAKKLK